MTLPTARADSIASLLDDQVIVWFCRFVGGGGGVLRYRVLEKLGDADDGREY